MKIFKRAIWIVSILVLLACNLVTGSANPAPPASPIPATTAPPVQVPATAAVSATATSSAPSTSGTGPYPLVLAREKIKHVVVIMQENRSFDEYFGTYPGADGIPMQNGVPTVCSPDPQTGQCLKPYYNPMDINSGGPHAAASAKADIDGGKWMASSPNSVKQRKSATTRMRPDVLKGKRRM